MPLEGHRPAPLSTLPCTPLVTSNSPTHRVSYQDSSHPTRAPVALAPDGVTVAPLVSYRRFLVLFMFSVFAFINEAQLTNYANIIRQMQPFFDSSAFSINMLPAYYQLFYFLGAFPICALVDRIGLRRSLLLATFLNVLGSGVKVIAAYYQPKYWMLVIAQVFNALAALGNMGVPPLLSAVWFPHTERSLSTAVGSLCAFLGMAAGFAVPPLIVNDTHHDPVAFGTLFGGILAVSGFAFLGTLVCVPTEPIIPPSSTAPHSSTKVARGILVNSSQNNNPNKNNVSKKKKVGGAREDAAGENNAIGNTPTATESEHSMAMREEEETERGSGERQPLLHHHEISIHRINAAKTPVQENNSREEQTQHDDDEATISNPSFVRQHLFQQMWALRKNRSFMIFIGAMGVIGGLASSTGTVLFQMVEPYGIIEESAGFMILFGIIAGCVGCMVVGHILDRYRRYKLPLQILGIVFVALCVGMVIALTSFEGKQPQTTPPNNKMLLLQQEIKQFVVEFSNQGQERDGASMTTSMVPTTTSAAPPPLDLHNTCDPTLLILVYFFVIAMIGTLIPMVPIGLEFAVELTYPVREVVPATACMWAVSFCAIVFTVVMASVIGSAASRAKVVGLVLSQGGILLIVVLVTMFVVKETRKRHEHEQTEQA